MTSKPARGVAPRQTKRSKRQDVTARDFEQAYALRRALREFLLGSERITHAHGLTTERYHALLYIHVATERGDDPTVSDLADALYLAPSSATQLVRRAEDLGLVRRELAAGDARIRYLRLTGEGYRRLAAAVAELHEERAKLAELVRTATSRGPGSPNPS